MFKRFRITRSGNSSNIKSFDELDSPVTQKNIASSERTGSEQSELHGDSSDDEVDGSKTYRKFSRKVDLINMNHLEEIASTHATESQRKQGHLVYYNRTELKTSDHRPVAAIIDVNVQYLIHSDFQAYVADTTTVCQKSSPLSILIKNISDASTTNSAKLYPITFQLYNTLKRFGEIAMIRYILECCFQQFQI